MIGSVTLTAIPNTLTSQATFSTNALTGGSHSITAAYQGNSGYSASTSAALPFTVGKAATRFAFYVADFISPAPLGSDVVLQAGINFPGPIPPSGTVLFEDPDRAITVGFAAVESSPGDARALLITDSLNAGTYSVTATYQGDANYLPCTSGALSFTVSQGSAAFTLTSAPNPSSAGQPVTFSAYYNYHDAPPPSGSVTFKDGTSTLGSVALSLGLANYTTSALSAGKHSITVVYGGDSNYTGSTSAVLTQTVNSAKTTATQTTLTSSLNPSLIGEPVNLTATVTGPGGTPTGAVAFMDGSTTIVSGVALGGGSATYQDPSLSAGTHSITAVYSGDSNYSGSTSPKLTQTVYSSPAATTTTLTSSANLSSPGQSVTFTATVTTSGPGTPTGVVTWWDGTTELGNFALNGNSASLTTSTLSLGAHSITANYGGDAVFAPSTSAALTQTVSTTTATTTSLTSSANSSNVGQSVTFTATVAPNGSGTPTGSVTFEDGVATLGSSNLSGGKASYSTSSLSAGTHSITAVYGGDSNYTASTSAVLTQKVITSAQFSDVPSSATYYDAANLMFDYGVTTGCEQSSDPATRLYCPDNTVTRQEMAAFIVRAVTGRTNPALYNPTPYFNDVPPAASFFPHIQKLVELGITSGCSQNPPLFCPTDTIPRWEMAVFMIRARLTLYGAAFSFTATPYFTDVPTDVEGNGQPFPFIQRSYDEHITNGCGGTLYCPDELVTRGQMASFIMRGLFNQTMAISPTAPYLTAVSPNALAATLGSQIRVTITGVNTGFQTGDTVTVPSGMLDVSNVAANSATSISATLTVNGTAVAGPQALVVTSGGQNLTLPLAIRVGMY
jgi:hypothetical protein